MPISVSWDEYNGAPAYASPSAEDLLHTHWGSTDTALLDPHEARIATGGNSFNKQQAVRFSGFAGETVDNFTLWCEDLSDTGVIPKRDGTDSGHRLYYKDTGAKTTSAPSASAIGSGVLMPFEQPVSPNIGGGPVTVDGDGTNVFLTQIQCGAATLESYGLLLSFEFEIA